MPWVTFCLQGLVCAVSPYPLFCVYRAWEAVREAKRPRVHTLIATSDIHMKHKLRMTRDQVSRAQGDGKAQSHARRCGGTWLALTVRIQPCQSLPTPSYLCLPRTKSLHSRQNGALHCVSTSNYPGLHAVGVCRARVIHRSPVAPFSAAICGVGCEKQRQLPEPVANRVIRTATAATLHTLN